MTTLHEKLTRAALTAPPTWNATTAAKVAIAMIAPCSCVQRQEHAQAEAWR